MNRLSVDFSTSAGTVHAVREATFDVAPGRLCGLVGESGSGKTVTGLAVAGLVDRMRSTTRGSIRLNDRELVGIAESQFQQVRGREVGMVFQDPMTALNPLLTIGRQVSESIEAHLRLDRRAARDAAIDVLRDVGMPEPKERYRAYPHQLSGGLRQRAMIAVAIACRPSLLIADEPTTALDVTIQAQILLLLRRLAESTGMAVLLITHDLGVVGQTCEDVVVMYAGEVVETGRTEEVLRAPAHPYTTRLLEARPHLDGWDERLHAIPGRVPAAWTEPSGCLFASRCGLATERCADDQSLLDVAPGRQARCWRSVQQAAALS